MSDKQSDAERLAFADALNKARHDTVPPMNSEGITAWWSAKGWQAARNPGAEVAQAVARGWLHYKNCDKEMDVDLASAISEEIHKLLKVDTTKPAEPLTDFDLRGVLASNLLCWHRLTVPEVDNLLEFFEATLRTALSAAQTEPVGENIKGWMHLANEWADAATNGPQYLKNVRDGICTFDEALLGLKGDIEHCREVSAALKDTTPPSPIGGEVTDAERKAFMKTWFADDFAYSGFDTRATAALTEFLRCRSAATPTKPAIAHPAQLPIGGEVTDDARMLLIHSLVASKGWNHGYAAAFVDDWFHDRRAATPTKPEGKDAERYRFAIAQIDNAEMLYACVLNNHPDTEKINAEFDTELAAIARTKPSEGKP